MHIYTYTYTHIHMHIYTYTYTHTHIHIHIYTYICTHIHIHIYAYTYTHTHIHTYTYTQFLKQSEIEMHKLSIKVGYDELDFFFCSMLKIYVIFGYSECIYQKADARIKAVKYNSKKFKNTKAN